MELQLRVARTTVDIDLTLPASLTLSSEASAATTAVREMLEEAASLDLGDWFDYTVGAPMKDLARCRYGGARYPNRMPHEIPAAEMRLISKEQQVAEKLHAYTLPRNTPNSRVKRSR